MMCRANIGSCAVDEKPTLRRGRLDDGRRDWEAGFAVGSIGDSRCSVIGVEPAKANKGEWGELTTLPLGRSRTRRKHPNRLLPVPPMPLARVASGSDPRHLSRSSSAVPRNTVSKSAGLEMPLRVRPRQAKASEHGIHVALRRSSTISSPAQPPP
jgi:hypothetical protein